jgi:hypothetical protein
MPKTKKVKKKGKRMETVGNSVNCRLGADPMSREIKIEFQKVLNERPVTKTTFMKLALLSAFDDVERTLAFGTRARKQHQ